MLFFGFFTKDSISFIWLGGGGADVGGVLEYRSYQRLKEARKRMPIVVSE